jgi:hypothetical protein
LRKLSAAVSAHKADLDDFISEEVKKNLRTINTNLRTLDKWHMSMDGGVSYKKFWENGDVQFQDLRNLIAEIE